VLLIACANAANLALARAASRRREIALRLAIGAGRTRIVRQLLVEALLIGAAAGTAALLAAEWTLRVLYRVALSLAALPWAISLNLEPDIRVFSYTLGIALVSGVVLGLLPALQASSPRIIGALQGQALLDGRLRGTTLRHALVVAQVAASLVLLFGAGLLLRALGSAEALDLGFKTSGVIYTDYDPRAARYTPSRAETFNAALLSSARSMPGVAAAALTSHVPLHGGVRRVTVRIVGAASLADPHVILSTVSPEYFSALQIPFVAGHGFAGSAAESMPSIVISEGLARRFWPGEPALGKAVSVPGSPVPRTVIGVVRDAANAAIWREKELAIYLPIDASTDPRDLRVLVRTTADASEVRRLLARRAASLAGDLRFSPTSLDELLRLWQLPSKVAASAVGALAAMALALACVGLYGVLTFAVGERTRELGIRMALGADASAVVRLILGDAWRLVLTGLVIGAACALPAAPLLGGLLFGVSAFDPLTLASVVLLLMTVALTASYAPARRASRLEPITVLRMD
jgi:predicted permease